MQAIMETLFDIVYLTLVITVGIRMIIEGRKEKQYFLFGVMAVILGTGDAFHLLPRAYALCTTGLENFTAALGVGKLVTSVTMTVFYVLLYYVWRIRYHVKGGTHRCEACPLNNIYIQINTNLSPCLLQILSYDSMITRIIC